jgi:site-specific DNA-cytosine methylase
MMKWVERARPPVVILENVSGPWEQKINFFEKRGYAAAFPRIDTKDYYIPQTRMRGYLLAVKRESSHDNRPRQWIERVKKLKRPASAPLDAFMLAPDDPRVLRGRERLTAESRAVDGDRAGRTDWTKCETRHQLARSEEELGDQRPFTGWSDSGHTTLPSFAWNDWCNSQVHRIHDLMDINTMRMAQADMDCTYKTMVWNLSQNVDRDTMGRLGLCQCITPTGVPYISNRGGPLIGEELLALQGIPANDLLLTKESEDNLKDLAGNAMTSTVVGAAILCALLETHKAISKNSGARSRQVSTVLPTLVPRSLIKPTETVVTTSFGCYNDFEISLHSRYLNKSEWHNLLHDATHSTKRCITENSYECIDPSELVHCKLCGLSARRENAVPPRKFEEHEFVPYPVDVIRVDPVIFRRRLLEYLPMRLEIANLDFNICKDLTELKDNVRREWLKQATRAVKEENESLLEFRFTELTRSHIWTAHYISCHKSRLECRISAAGVEWLLFAAPPLKDGLLGDLLIRPIARMQSKNPEPDHSSVSLTDGYWEICGPVNVLVSLTIEGVGQQIPSWRNRLGLGGDFANECQFERLKITMDESVNCDRVLKNTVDGIYKVLPKSGTACGSLMKKKNGSDDDPLYVFLESGRKTLPQGDTFIFSNTCHRTSYGEYRHVYLMG